jgi:PAS domain S-box-containing protein/putative nucleotidyltransferase with HDIG domain
METANNTRKWHSHFDIGQITILFVIACLLFSIPLYVSNIIIAEEKKSITNQLQTISNLKAASIDEWFRATEEVSQLIANDSLLAETVEHWLVEGKKINQDHKLILNRLKAIKSIYNFDDVVLFDLDNTPILTHDGNTKIDHSYGKNQTLQPQKIIIGDLHKHQGISDTDHTLIELHIVIPLSIDKDRQNRMIGSLLIILDANKQLFPLVKAWPLISQTGESLLAMRMGNEVVFPHKLRFSNEPEFTLKFPVDDPDLAASAAFRGYEGSFEATDYRQENVIAVSSKTMRANWVLITKIDLDEIYGSLTFKLMQITLLIVLILVSLIGTAYFWRRNVRLAHQKEQEQAKIRLHALNKHYVYLTKNANDIILLADDIGVIMEVNNRAVQIYQYSREELIGKNILDLEDKSQEEEDREKLFSVSKEGLVFETLHLRKDKSVLPVEISYRSISVDNIIFRQLIIQDITERRKTLAVLHRVERRFQLAAEASHTGVWDWDIIHDKIWWSPEQYFLLGFENQEIDTNTYKIMDIIHPQDKERNRVTMIAHLKGKQAYNIECRLRTKSGEYRWFKLTGSAKKNRQGQSVRMLGSTLDITERKLSDQRLMSANRALQTLSAGNVAVVYARTEEELLANISNVMVDEGGYMLSRVCYLDMDNKTPAQLVAKASRKDVSPEKFDDSNFLQFLNRHSNIKKVIKTGEHVVCQDILNDPEFTGLRTQAFMDGYVAMMVLPLKDKNEVFGLLIIYSSSTFAFNEKETELLVELANDLAYGITSLRMKERQNKIEDKLVKSEIKTRMAVEGTKQGIWEYEIKDRKITFDKTWMKILGYETDQYTYDYAWWEDHLVPESLQYINEMVENYLRGKTDLLEGEFQFKDSQGRIKWGEMRGLVSERDADGAPLKMVGSQWETTDLKKLLDEHEHHEQFMEAALIETIKAISLTTEKRDPYTAGHQNRVSQLATAIARELDLSEDRIKGVELGSLIHDIGKIYIPSEILNRPGKLTNAEFEMIKSHSEVGFDIIKDINFPWPVAQMIYQHHERLDGSGYPRGLKGDEIILEAQIIAVADVVEAVSSHRPYRPALGIEEGIKIIEAHKGDHFNPEIVDICIHLIREKRFDFYQDIAA